MPAAFETLRELDHRGDLARRVRHGVWLAPAQAPHVLQKRTLLAPSEVAPAHLVPRGALQDRLVDVRDVLGVAHPLPAGLQQACEDVEDEERARMAQVRGVVRGHTADVHRRGTGSRLEGEGAAPVHGDAGGASFAAILTEPVADIEPLHNSTTVCRIDAEKPLAVGQFAVLDFPAADVAGDEIRMRAADDLAGCALIVSVLLALRGERAPHDVHAIFTRAEETGLYGARLAAEDGLVPRDAYVISVEASRALPGAEARP